MRIIGNILLAVITFAALYGATVRAETVEALADNTVNFGPIVEIAGAFLAAAATALVALAGRYISAKTGIELDLKNNAVLNEALDAGVNFAVSKVADRSKIEVDNALVRTAAGYVITGVPKALRYFDLTPDRVEEMVAGRLAERAHVEVLIDEGRKSAATDGS